MKRPLVLNSESYTTKLKELEGGLFCLEREHVWEKDSIQVDVFPYSWMLFVGSFEAGQLRLGKEEFEPVADTPFAVFLPRLRVMRSKVRASVVRWRAYVSSAPLINMPKEPSYFLWKESWSVSSLESIEQILDDVESFNVFDPEDSLSSVVLKTKRFIDKNFLAELSIQQIADELNIPYSTMCHYFKKAIGISPNKYRRKLRSGHAGFLISQSQLSSMESCYQSGYSDYSSFKDGFKKSFGVTPSSFSWKD